LYGALALSDRVYCDGGEPGARLGYADAAANFGSCPDRARRRFRLNACSASVQGFGAMRRPLLAGGLLLSLAGIASSESAPSPDEALSPMELLSSISLKPAQPSGAKSEGTRKARAGGPSDAIEKVDRLTQCLRDWDAATHMTRQEWARTCRRVVSDRSQFIRDQDRK
jgi:hypothetical protein